MAGWISRPAVTGALLLMLSTFAPAILPAQGIPSSGVPVFRIGDAIRIVVWNSNEFSGTFEIAEDGTIIHPLYRAITLAGMSLPQAETEIRRLLQRFHSNPELVIEPLFRIPVAGAVNSPNVYTLPPQATLAQALSDAGGPAGNANLRRARLIREGRETIVDLTRPNNEFTVLRVRSGDQIIIERRQSVWTDRIEPALRTAGAVASLAYLFLRLDSRIR